MTLPAAKARRIVRAAIHPAIGVARVGNSADEFFFGPEVIDPPPAPAGSYRDKTGALKRQAARFRIYGYDCDGEVVGEVTSDVAKVEWTAHVANRKAAWYQFQIALDIPEASSAEPSLARNPGIADRTSLVIDPGARSISGPGQGGASHAFDTGTFMGKTVYLGELRTDEKARLIFLGGRGKSGSHDGKPATTFANNDGWFDDTSDGPVTATVSVDGKSIPVAGAWVVVCPPNYAPGQQSVRTMYDLLFDLFVRTSAIPRPRRPSFARHILPLFQRMSRLQWVNAGFAAAFGWNGVIDFSDPPLIARLSDPSDDSREFRRTLANHFRSFPRDSWSPTPWPWVYGDAMNVPPEQTPREHAAITDTQLHMLAQWAAGDFDADPVPPASSNGEIGAVSLSAQPATLDEAALAFCLADAFHPGCELTWPMRHATMYEAPFRIRHRPGDDPEPAYGTQLTPQAALAPDGPLEAQAAGCLTRWMAIPWQTDTASCRSGYWAGYGTRYDPYLPTFWPARVPNQVLAEDDYRLVMDKSKPLADRLAAFAQRSSWFRQLGPGSYIDQINKLAGDISIVGIVEERPGIPNDAHFPATMEVEQLAAPLAGVPPGAGTLLLNVAATGASLARHVAVAAKATGLDEEEITAGVIDKVNRFPRGLRRD